MASWNCPSRRLYSCEFAPASQPQPLVLGRTVREEALGSDPQALLTQSLKLGLPTGSVMGLHEHFLP